MGFIELASGTAEVPRGLRAITFGRLSHNTDGRATERELRQESTWGERIEEEGLTVVMAQPEGGSAYDLYRQREDFDEAVRAFLDDKADVIVAYRIDRLVRTEPTGRRCYGCTR